MINLFCIIICVLSIIFNILSSIFIKKESLNPHFLKEDFTNFTFVTVPREPKTPTQFALLRFVVSSWIMSSNNSRAIFIINPSEFDVNHTLLKAVEDDFGPGKLIYQPTLKVSRNNVPYINNFFESAVYSTPFNILTLINSDILILPGWIDKINQIFEIFGETAFITGYRLNIDVEDYSVLLNRSFKNFDLMKFINSCPQTEYSYRGMDFFTFLNHPDSKFFENIPPFLMGQYEWDNWLVGKMNLLYQTISLGPDFRVVHINHPSFPRKRFNEYSAYNKRLRFMYYAPTSDNKHTKWTFMNRTKIVSEDKKIEMFLK